MQDSLKALYMGAIITLARKSGLYPQCLHLEGVTIATRPVASGTFGDIYKGEVRGHAVAVKVFRPYEDSDITKLLKVCFFCSQQQSYGLSYHFRLLRVRQLFGNNWCIVRP